MPDPSSARDRRFPRRLLLGGAGALSLGLSLSGCTDAGTTPARAQRAYCVARDSLERNATLAGRPLVYEVSEERSRFWFEPGFRGQLERWLADYTAESSSEVDQLWTYGSWIDGGSRCDSWHHAGRAFDLARLRLAGGEFVSCRSDQWPSGGDARRAAERDYWALAASLHRHFGYVLTYLYDAAHANHIHVDNGRFGAAMSTFSPRSAVQVQAVQAICTHVWDAPVPTSGDWDVETRRVVSAVLEQTGASGDLTDGVEPWHAFLTASARRARPV